MFYNNKFKYKEYTNQVDDSKNTTATIDDIRSLLYIDGEVGIYQKNLQKQNQNVQKKSSVLERLSYSNITTLQKHQVICNHKNCIDHPYNCKIYSILTSKKNTNNIWGQKKKNTNTEFLDLKHKYVIHSKSFDIKIEHHNLQHFRCQNSNKKINVLGFGSKMKLQYYSNKIIKELPKIMVHYNNEYEDIFEITKQFYITYPVVSINI